MLFSTISRESSRSSLTRPVSPRAVAFIAPSSSMSRPISSWTGPSWMKSDTLRRTSSSPTIVRRLSSRARSRPAVSKPRSSPMTAAVPIAATAKTVS